MTYKKNENINYSNGFTIVELIIVFVILAILASISVPSSLRWIYKQEQKAYLGQLKTFLDLVRRETRRYGISCELSPHETGSSPMNKNILSGRLSQSDIPSFNVRCFGLEGRQTSIYNQIPSLGLNNFQEISSSIKFTPKGQVAHPNNSINPNSIVIVVGPKESKMAISKGMVKCLSIQAPSGIVFAGEYNQPYRFDPSRKSSSYNYSLKDQECR